MAGDWIKMTVGLPDKPEVWRIAGLVGIDPDSVVGKLLRVWVWFDANTEDGNAVGVTHLLIDRIANVIGFAEAMSTCGWLEQRGNVLTLPNFSRHNGKTAKNRALTNDRVAKARKMQRLSNAESNAESNDECNAECVTKSVTREEKIVNPPIAPKKPGAMDVEKTPGFVSFWAAYPRKVSKPQAINAWRKLNPDEVVLAAILSAIERYSRSDQWLRDGGKFIPHPSTWLNNRRWEDLVEPPVPGINGSGSYSPPPSAIVWPNKPREGMDHPDPRFRGAI